VKGGGKRQRTKKRFKKKERVHKFTDQEQGQYRLLKKKDMHAPVLLISTGIKKRFYNFKKWNE